MQKKMAIIRSILIVLVIIVGVTVTEALNIGIDALNTKMPYAKQYRLNQMANAHIPVSFSGSETVSGDAQTVTASFSQNGE
jgi:hypothetical protein